MESPQFTRKIYLGLATLFLTVFVLVGTGFLAIHRVTSAGTRDLARLMNEVLLANELSARMTAMRSLMPVFVLSGEPALLPRFREMHERFRANLDESERATTDPAVLRALEEIRREEEKVYQLAGPGIDLRLHGASPERVHAYFHGRAKPGATTVGERIEELKAGRTVALETARTQHQARTGNILQGLFWISGAALFLLFTAGYLLVRLIQKKKDYDTEEERVSRARKEVVEMVAHDLKSPLATAQMSLELIAETLPGPTGPAPLADGPGLAPAAKARDLLEMNRRALAAMGELVGNLLDHAKIEARALALDPENVDLAEALARAADAIGLQLRTKQLRLELSCPRLPVRADPARLQQALGNLLGNALKFSPRGGRIFLEGRACSDGAELVIRDEGPGIPAEQLGHLFDRYWQARATAKQGTGLGLAIVKGIVDAHGGRILVESAGGGGTTVRITLPLASQALLQPQSHEVDELPHAQRSLLLVGHENAHGC